MPLIERVCFPAADEHRLAWVQRLLGAALVVRIGFGPYRALAGQPRELWRPRGVTWLLGGMPSEAVIIALQVIGVAAGAWVVFAPAGRRWRRPAFAVAWLALVVLAGLRTSLGKVFHNDVLLILAAVPVMWSTFSARLDGTRRSPAFGWPLATATAVIALAYFFSGYQKVLSSGPAWVLSDNMTNVMAWGRRRLALRPMPSRWRWPDRGGGAGWRRPACSPWSCAFRSCCSSPACVRGSRWPRFSCTWADG